MSSKHPKHKETKKPGNTSERAMKDADRHTVAAQKEVDAVPAAETGAHAHSPAAHLHEAAHAHTKPMGDMRQIENLKEPPREIGRVGKQNRGK